MRLRMIGIQIHEPGAMSGKREWFSKFESCSVDIVTLGDGNLHEVKGKGAIPMYILENRVN